jgi:hypothetical protein
MPRLVVGGWDKVCAGTGGTSVRRRSDDVTDVDDVRRSGEKRPQDHITNINRFALKFRAVTLLAPPPTWPLERF